jgi:hypothetical protein
MRPGMNPLQVTDRDVGVARRGGEVGMAQDRLQVPDVGTVVQHVGRHGVAQQVAGATLGQAGPRHTPSDEIAQPVPNVRLAGVAEEHGSGRI